MSREVDERVVQLQLENQDFMSKATQTMAMIANLGKSLLNLGKDNGSTLNDISSTLKDMPTDKMASGIDVISSKFTNMGVIGMRVLENIADKLFQTGERMVKSLTIDRVSGGWTKFGQKTAAVQTIMAATAQEFDNTEEQMAAVEAQLDKLGWYADETSYSFTDMTTSIGKFTSAGVGLEKATNAVMGISNWAARSGANVNEAGRAMYNLAQAMSVGAVKLMDWKSIENANMSTVAFKDAVIETAVEMGQLERAADGVTRTLEGTEVTAENFSSTLSEGWFSSEVLVDVLNNYNKFSDALYNFSDAADLTATQAIEMVDAFADGSLDMKQAMAETGLTAAELNEYLTELSDDGMKLSREAFKNAQEAKTFGEVLESVSEAAETAWSKIFENIFGNYEEAKVLFTRMSNELYDLFVEPLNGIVSTLTQWKGWGGRDALIEGFWNLWDNGIAILDRVKEALAEVFPPTTASQLLNLTVKFKQWTESIKLSDETLDKIKRTAKGIFSVFGIVSDAVGAVIDIFKSLFKVVSPMGSSFLDTTAAIGDFIVGLREAIQASGVFKTAVESIKTVVVLLWTGLSNLGKALKDAWEGIAGAFDISGITNFFSGLQEGFKSGEKAALSFKGVIDAVFGFFSNIIGRIGGIVQKVVGVISKLFQGITKIDFSKLFNMAAIGSIATNFQTLSKTMTGFIESFKDFSGIGKGIKGVFDSLKKAFQDFSKNMDMARLKSIATSILMIAASVAILANCDTDALLEATSAVSILMVVLSKISTMFDGVKMKNAKAMNKATSALIKMAIAIAILAKAIKPLGEMDLASLAKGVGAVIVLMASMAGVSQLFGKSAKNMNKGAIGMIAMAAAIKILVEAIYPLAYLNWEQLGKVGASLVVFLGSMAGASALMAKAGGKGAVKNALLLLAMAQAIKMVVDAIAPLAGYDWESLGKVGSGFTLIVAGLTASMAVIANTKGNLNARDALALIALAQAIKMVVDAVAPLAGYDWESLGKIGSGFAVIVTGLTIAMNTLANSKGELKTGDAATLVAFAVSMLIVVKSLEPLASYDWESLGKMGAGMAAVVLSMIGVLKILSSAEGGVKGAGTLIALAGAVMIMAGALKVLSGIGLGPMAIAVGGMTVALAALIAAAMFAQACVPGLAALAAAMLAIGAAAALFGVGVAAVGVGVAALAAGITALVVAISAAPATVVAGLTSLLSGIISLIPNVASALIEAFNQVLVGLKGSVSAIFDLVKELIIGGCATLIETAPTLANTFFQLILTGLDMLIDYVPQMVDKLATLFVNALTALAERIPDIVAAGFAVVEALIKALIDTIGQLDPAVLAEGLQAAGILAAILTALIALGALAIGAIAGTAALGLWVVELAGVLALLGGLNNPALQWFIGEGGALLSTLANVIGNVIGAFIGGIGEGITASMPEMATNLSNFMTNLGGFLDGAKQIDSGVTTSLQSLATAILTLTAADVISGLTSWVTGGASMESFAADLTALGPAMASFGEAVKDVKPAAIRSAAEAAKMLSEMMNNMPKEGGLKQLFGGETTDMASFGTQLSALGAAMAAFGIQGALINTDGVAKGVSAAEQVAKIPEALGNEGGVVGFFKGNSVNMADFGTQLTALGTNLKTFSETCADIQVDNMPKVIRAVNLVAEMSKNIIDSGATENTEKIKKFLRYLGDFGGYTADFVNNLGDISGDAPVKATYAAGMVKAISSGFAGIDAESLADQLKQVNDAGEELTVFATTMSGFATALADFSTDALSKTTAIGDALVNLGRGLSALNESGLANNVSLTNLGSALSQFGQSLATYSTNISGIDPAQLNNISTALSQLGSALSSFAGGEGNLVAFSDAITSLGTGAMDSFLAAINRAGSEAPGALFNMLNACIASVDSLSGQLNGKFTNILNEALNGISDRTSLFTQKGKAIIEAFVDGISSANSSVTTAMTAIGNAADNAIRSKYNAFVASGKYIVDGLIKGINDNKARAMATARSLAQSLSDTVNAALDIGSPSKVFGAIGKWVVLGLAEGITGNKKKSDKAAATMATSVINTAKKTLEIKSPSRVARDELGNYIVEGIAEGIDKNTSAEEAMQKKCQNIISAFQAEFAKWDLDAETMDLEQKLWEALNPKATDAEKRAKQMELLDKKLLDQQDRINAAAGQYKAVSDLMGADSEEAQEAYNTLLKEQYTLTELAKNYNELRDEILHPKTKEKDENFDRGQALHDYNEAVANLKDELIALGYTEQEVMHKLATEYGLDDIAALYEDKAAEAVPAEKDAAAMIEQAMQKVDVTVKDGFDKVKKTSAYESFQAGHKIGTDLAAGIDETKNEPVEAIGMVKDEAMDELNSGTEDAKAVGEAWCVALGDAIMENETAITNAAKEAAINAFEETMAMLMGGNFGGMNGSTASLINNFTESFSSGMSEGMKQMRAQEEWYSNLARTAQETGQALEELIAEHPFEVTLQPVLDSDSMATLNRQLTTTLIPNNSNVTGVVNNQNGGTGGPTQVVNNYNNNFEQNITSPKAVSRAEVYRDTNNMFTSFADRVIK